MKRECSVMDAFVAILLCEKTEENVILWAMKEIHLQCIACTILEITLLYCSLKK